MNAVIKYWVNSRAKLSAIVAPALLGSSIALASSAYVPVFALPSLQLDIIGGTYSPSGTGNIKETVVTSNPIFDLVAYCVVNNYTGTPGKGENCNWTVDHFVSMAIAPKTSSSTPSSDYGSFKVSFDNGVNWTLYGLGGNPLTYGVPPLEGVLATDDPGDLADHGVFDTHFGEIKIGNFLNGSISNSGIGNVGLRNSVDVGSTLTAGSNPNLLANDGTKLAYRILKIDASGLKDGYDLHFDLYNTKVVECGKNKSCTAGDIDINDFAPFSHDAGTTNLPPDNPDVGPAEVPEPGTVAGLAVAAAAAGGLRRRNRKSR
jgi:hypothetical protein